MKTNYGVFVAILLLTLLFASCLPKQEILRQPSAGNSTLPEKESIPGRNTETRPVHGSGGTAQIGIDYIEQYKTIAIEEMNLHGIPASIKLAQAMLESGNGNSRLALEANNHFGIKCTPEWTGGRIVHNDDRPDDCFRIYQNAEDSFRDHSAFLLRRRYEKLFSLDKNDYKGWARGLKEAGYATNPRYADLLISLIERYELHQYDNPGSYPVQTAQSPVSPVSPAPRPVASQTAATAPQKSSSTMEQSRGLMKIHEVAQGESLNTIATLYGMTQDRLIKLNQLKSPDLNIGQLLVVSD